MQGRLTDKSVIQVNTRKRRQLTIKIYFNKPNSQFNIAACLLNHISFQLKRFATMIQAVNKREKTLN